MNILTCSPNTLAKLWNLSDDYARRLEQDFVNGIFFLLDSKFTIKSFTDYAKAAIRYGSEYSLDQAAIEGRSLPTYHNFKSTYPEYFI